MKRIMLVIIIAGVIVGIVFGFIVAQSSRKPLGKPDNTSVIDPYPREILGQSAQLSGKDLEEMKSWKQKVYNLARLYRGQFFLSGVASHKTVCLTFDDGPDPIVTPQVIDTLKNYNVRGSFFFIGERIRKYPNVVREAFHNEDLVLNHSFSHPRLDRVDRSRVKQEIMTTEQAIFDVIGKKPLLIRPPYGGIDSQVVEDVYNDGYRAVLWSVDTLDWTGKTPYEITQCVLDNVRPGDIILFHTNENRIATAQALPEIIYGLQQRGYHVIDLAQMLGTAAYQ
ncbi:MAG: polysaccharide deacetylase family protein [Acidobacteriota bacterium]